MTRASRVGQLALLLMFIRGFKDDSREIEKHVSALMQTVVIAPFASQVDIYQIVEVKLRT